VCYHNLPVTIVGVGGGYSYGHNGPTHHALEDIAVMRVLPNMTVVCPGDPTETELAVAAAAAHGRPLYLRIGRAGDARVHESPPEFRIGESITVREGLDCTLISTGGILPVAVAASKRLGDAGISCRVVNMHTVKPLDDAGLRKCWRETGAIFTVEEHSRMGGLGSAIAEWAVTNEQPSPRCSFGAEDCFASVSGSQNYLRNRNGLAPEHLAGTIAGKLGKKAAC
jgi:transketolase